MVLAQCYCKPSGITGPQSHVPIGLLRKSAHSGFCLWEAAEWTLAALVVYCHTFWVYLIGTLSAIYWHNMAQSQPITLVRTPSQTHEDGKQSPQKKLWVENTTSKLPLSPPQDSTSMVDLIDTSINTQPEPPLLTIYPPTSSFGQSLVMLSSDSQASCESFNIATNSVLRIGIIETPRAQPQTTGLRHRYGRPRRPVWA